MGAVARRPAPGVRRDDLRGRSRDVRDVEFVGAISDEASLRAGGTVRLGHLPVPAVGGRTDPPRPGPRRPGDAAVRTAPATFRVVDLLRNGVPMSEGSSRPEPATHRGRRDAFDSLRCSCSRPTGSSTCIVENRGAKTSCSTRREPRSSWRRTTGSIGCDGSITSSLDVGARRVGRRRAHDVPGAGDGRRARPVARLRQWPGRPGFEFPLTGPVTVVPPLPPVDASSGRSAHEPSFTASQASTPRFASRSASVLRSRGTCSYSHAIERRHERADLACSG